MPILNPTRAAFDLGDFDRNRRTSMPLHVQAQLANEALIAISAVEIIADVVDKRKASLQPPDIAMLEQAVELLDSLNEGADYLKKRTANLIPRPNSVDTVLHIQRQSTIEIDKAASIAASLFGRMIKAPDSVTSIPREELLAAQELGRIVHGGIMDRLESTRPDLGILG